MNTNKKPNTKKRTFISVGIIVAALGISYVPLPGVQKTVIVVSGSELQEPLEEIEPKFEKEYPHIQLDIKIQGSQDTINNYIDKKNDFDPTILIPANAELISQLRDRWQTQHQESAFYGEPTPIAKTMLVGVAWPQRGQVLFPGDRFQWKQIEQAMQQRNWNQIGGQSNWGSFDFLTTNPTRSNSGQLTLSLWTRHKTKANSTLQALQQPAAADLIGLVKRSVYQPPRSTDILLQEFITRGPNEVDVATVYESIALHRWSQSKETRNQPYQIYYIDPTIETVSTAAIVRRNVGQGKAKAAKTFLDFLTTTQQQKVFVRYGFRPVAGNIDLSSVANSPWSKGMAGSEVNPNVQTVSPPNQQAIAELQRLWQRSSN